jgi:hypothetical protein
MVYKRKFRVMMALFILAAMLIFPVHLFAQEATETVEHEAGFYYTVQKGDTLWDLSTQFSDNPWLWPNLWSENSQISNPHWIYPGERIRLFHVKGVDTFITKNVEENQSKESEPIKETLYYYYSPINSIGFIKKQAITPQGTIFKVKDDKDLVSAGDIVYIRPNVDDSFQPGTKYTVYRTLKPIVDEKTKDLVGIQHYLTGVVVITKKEPGFLVARVVKSYRSIALNDLLMPYKKRSPRIALTQSKNGLDGKIIVTEEHDNNIGDHTVAFINKGDQDGVEIGQSYSIYYQEKGKLNKKSKEEALLTPIISGSLLVLQTEPTTSTVLITRSDRSIDPGAKFFSPIK